MTWRASSCLLAVLCGGCGLATAGIGPISEDAGPIGFVDSGLRDSGASLLVDAFVPPGPDAGSPPMPDAGPPPVPDAGPAPTPDAGPPPTPDAGPPPTPDAGPPSCSAIFGTAATHDLCAERATECELYVTLSGRSCTDFCGDFLATCAGAYSDSSGTCTRGSAGLCGDTHSDEICICSR